MSLWAIRLRTGLSKTQMIRTHPPHSPTEPEFERANTPPKTRPRSSEELLNDGPIALRRRVEVPPQQLDLTPGELRVDHGASITDNWIRSGTAEPRIDFVERQQDREREETNALIAFYTDRGVGYKYRPKKKGKRSKNVIFETSDQFTQLGLTESRKVEWAKWKQFNAVYQYRDPNWSNCWLKDTSRFHFNGLTSTKTSINDAKVVLMLLRCLKVDWSAAEIWRKPLV